MGWEADSNWGTPTPSSNEEGNLDSGAEPPVVIQLGAPILLRVHEDPGVVSVQDAPEAISQTAENRVGAGENEYMAQQGVNIAGLSSRGRLNQCAGFLERILDEFSSEALMNVDRSDEESDRLLSDLEMVLGRLWMKFERGP